LRSKGIVLAILVVVSTILVVSVSVVKASELVPTKMLTLELPVAITVVAILTLVCAVVVTVYKQRLITIHYAKTGDDTCPNPEALNTDVSMMAQLTWPGETGRVAYPNYCDRCGQRLALTTTHY